MTGAEVLDIARDGIWVLIIVSAPMMIVGLVVGVVIALFQALTQIQEMTLVFVPKILAIFVTMLVALPFMGDVMSGYMNRVAEMIVWAAEMISLNWLPEAAFLYLLIFARVGTMLMLIPALGEQVIPARLRLGFALAFTLILQPLIAPSLPPMPADIVQIVLLVVHELAVGLIIGALARVMVMGTQIAGSIIAFQIGLSVAQSADPTNGGIQGAIIGSFLSFLGITLIFATDLHHVALAAIHDSYMIFSPTTPLMFDDAAQLAIETVSGAFVIGVQMSAPFIVFGLVFYLGIGILGRLMPQLQVFFIAMPATISVGLILLAVLLTMMMGWYLMHFESGLAMLRGA